MVSPNPEAVRLIASGSGGPTSTGIVFFQVRKLADWISSEAGSKRSQSEYFILSKHNLNVQRDHVSDDGGYIVLKFYIVLLICSIRKINIAIQLRRRDLTFHIVDQRLRDLMFTLFY